MIPLTADFMNLLLASCYSTTLEFSELSLPLSQMCVFKDKEVWPQSNKLK